MGKRVVDEWDLAETYVAEHGRVDESWDRSGNWGGNLDVVGIWVSSM
jgi:hypothetical protein